MIKEYCNKNNYDIVDVYNDAGHLAILEIAKQVTQTLHITKQKCISKVIEMNSIEQNRVALYLFNTINSKIKKYKSIDNTEQMF